VPPWSRPRNQEPSLLISRILFSSPLSSAIRFTDLAIIVSFPEAVGALKARADIRAKISDPFSRHEPRIDLDSRVSGILFGSSSRMPSNLVSYERCQNYSSYTRQRPTFLPRPGYVNPVCRPTFR
jgi:hypothetical protein